MSNGAAIVHFYVTTVKSPYERHCEGSRKSSDAVIQDMQSVLEETASLFIWIATASKDASR